MTGGLWVLNADIPAGARLMPDAPPAVGGSWVSVNVLGQHLPQMYQPHEIHDLDPAGCPALGLCPDCLGFGTTADLPGFYPYGIDEVAAAVGVCPACEGTGRPFLRVQVTRDASGIQAAMRVLPHDYVPPASPKFRQGCMGCGDPDGAAGEWHRSGGAL